VRPHVLADAWLPPFVKNAFDVVILDPPYVAMNQQMKQQLLRASAFIARESVIWFHTQWIASDTALSLRRSWLVRVGDSCSVRCIQVFRVKRGEKKKPRNYFTRGPAIKYNRWLAGQTGLPFERSA
jgi:methylase of polypeptide subunit release factors